MTLAASYHFEHTFDKLDTMATWSEFTHAAPALAAAIRAAFHQYGPGLAYLATIRPSGGPRLHPVSPVVTEDAVYCCVLDTPKRRDLDRDGRYALHAYPSDDSDDEASIRGRARRVRDLETVKRIAADVRAMPEASWWLYEFDVESAIYVRRPAERAGGLAQVWHAPPTNGRESQVQLVIRPR